MYYIATGLRLVNSYKLLGMHLYFSGIGGAGIGPLALIAHQAGYSVSGSDKQASAYISYLRQKGINSIHIGQSLRAIEQVDKARPIDWFIYSSALTLENPNAEELLFAKNKGIRVSKRDELINEILDSKGLKMIAIAGTHGKTTTTAMATWLFKDAGLPISYLLPAKTSFAEMGEYDPNSQYFIYEADEFDRNFLSFKPYLSLISGVSWDHHEIFPSREDYQQAFRQFISQSNKTYVWQSDASYLNLDKKNFNIAVLNPDEPQIKKLGLKGLYNRFDAWLTIKAIGSLVPISETDLEARIRHFPGLSRRMEEIMPNLYSDYAHTPEKIKAAINTAREIADAKHQSLVVVYEPLTDRRQHYIKELYKDCFIGVDKLYWVPSYLAREDSNTPILKPVDLIPFMANASIATAADKNNQLKQAIEHHLSQGAMVVGIAGGGGGSLDDWLRQEFKSS
jgi:UDP-N-acetylmuramate--alanine ligase